VSDADGDPLAWDLSIDGQSVASGTGSDPQSFTQAYADPGTHVATLTASDGQSTVQRQVTVSIT